MIAIKLAGAAVFIAAVLVGVGLLATEPGLYYVAIALSGSALLTVLLSALPWRRRPPRYP
jgi:hypothetical protein